MSFTVNASLFLQLQLLAFCYYSAISASSRTKESRFHCTSNLAGSDPTILAGPILPPGLSSDLISINCSLDYTGSPEPSIHCALEPEVHSLPLQVHQWSEKSLFESEWKLNSRLEIVAERHMDGSRFKCWVLQESEKNTTETVEHEAWNEVSWISGKIQVLYFQYYQSIQTINKTGALNESCSVQTNLPCHYNWLDISMGNSVNTGKNGHTSFNNSSYGSLKQSGRHLVLEPKNYRESGAPEIFQCQTICDYKGQRFEVTANTIIVVSPISNKEADSSAEVVGAIAGSIIAVLLILFVIVIVCLAPLCTQRADQSTHGSCPKPLLTVTGACCKGVQQPEERLERPFANSDEKISEALLCKNDDNSEILRARITELEAELCRMNERNKSSEDKSQQSVQVINETKQNDDQKSETFYQPQLRSTENHLNKNYTETTTTEPPNLGLFQNADEKTENSKENNENRFPDGFSIDNYLKSQKDIELVNGRLGKLKDIKIERKLIILGLESSGSIDQVCSHTDLTTTDSTKVIRSTPTAVLNESSACAHNNILYVVGIGTGRNEVWKFTPMLQSWSRCANLPAGRRRFALASTDSDQLYVLGGWSNEKNLTLDSVLSYDMALDRWKAKGRLRYAVRSAASIEYKGSIYLYGGADIDNKAVNYIQEFNTVNNTCKLLSSPMPRSYKLMKAVLWNDTVILMGRYACFIWDFEKSSWQSQCQFRTGVDHFGLVLDNDTIYVAGGGKAFTDSNGKQSWICSDEVVAVSVVDLIAGKLDFQLRHHAKLSKPALVHAYSPTPLAMPCFGT